MPTAPSFVILPPDRAALAAVRAWLQAHRAQGGPGTGERSAALANAATVRALLRWALGSSDAVLAEALGQVLERGQMLRARGRADEHASPAARELLALRAELGAVQSRVTARHARELDGLGGAARRTRLTDVAMATTEILDRYSPYTADPAQRLPRELRRPYARAAGGADRAQLERALRCHSAVPARLALAHGAALDVELVRELSDRHVPDGYALVAENTALERAVRHAVARDLVARLSESLEEVVRLGVATQRDRSWDPDAPEPEGPAVCRSGQWSRNLLTAARESLRPDPRAPGAPLDADQRALARDLARLVARGVAARRRLVAVPPGTTVSCEHEGLPSCVYNLTAWIPTRTATALASARVLSAATWAHLERAGALLGWVSDEVTATLLRRPDLPRPVALRLSAAPDTPSWMRVLLARRWGADPEIRAVLRARGGALVLRELAATPNARDAGEVVGELAARRPRTAVRVLRAGQWPAGIRVPASVAAVALADPQRARRLRALGELGRVGRPGDPAPPATASAGAPGPGVP